ncbi:MAG: hypothetical protein IPN37_14680 [Betaproteobacteria bacterium]|nr:hypothetical protein [Betaproteobacteria bacterium]MBK7459644.1 hypothetical protein [Betaproteobacteria bacterium]MBK7515722.1 hypothetical protein [Betaproteobacteria bacterium]MBK8106521.1 hypothetical protein [Betaproteobacteria bacterium]MBK8865204.1 hypothetical protein [Betaproteobacteria bacterium]
MNAGIQMCVLASAAFLFGHGHGGRSGERGAFKEIPGADEHAVDQTPNMA